MDSKNSKPNNDNEIYDANIRFQKQPKYEDRINLNASNIIQGVWDSIYEDKKVS